MFIYTGLCISWETGLYNKWWPQTSIPAFKIISSRCLKRVRTGEQISLVRMKVSWPLSSREAVLHYFAFEYLQEDLIVVLFNSISDSESIDRSSHGFTREGIPKAEELVRIGVVGGFACQKVDANRCYFRVIASLDMKLDMVPPSFINFISRQLLGSGFKLFKKEVASVSAGDENFREALKDPFYTRISEGLDSKNSTRDLKRGASISVEDQSETTFEDPMLNEIDELKRDDEAIDRRTLKSSHCGTDKVTISPEVEQALKILEKVNSIVREHVTKAPVSRMNGVDLTNLDEKCVEESITSEGDRKCDEVCLIDEARVKESNSYTRETNQSKIGTNSSMNQKSNKGKSVSRLKNIKSRFRRLRIFSS
ncbi:hypothetical protein ACS0TY_016449 [Phlomoides rotata]